MSSSSQNPLRSRDSLLSSANRGASLNPNAAEFVPSALRHLSIQNKSTDLAPIEASGMSNYSDDEAHQYWRGQLPDDITPDFNVTSQQDFPFSGLSINGPKSPMFSMVKALDLPTTQPNFSLQQQIRSPKLDNPSTSRLSSIDNYLEEKLLNDSWNLNMEKVASGSMMLDHLEYLLSQFPSFAFESIAEVYYANGGNLKSTVEMLTQLELKADAGLNQNMSAKSVITPSLNTLDFHLLHKNGNGSQKLQQPEGFPLFKSPSLPVDTPASRVFIPNTYGRQSQDGLADLVKLSPNRDKNLVMSAYNNVPGKAFLGDHSDGYGKLSLDLMTAQVYSDMREDGQDLACLRSTLFEPQEKHAYSIGNKALGKELYVKSQLYNFNMKEAQEKSIHNQRGQNPLIDLHGLHVNEAMHVLKHELSILRRTAKTAGRRLQVMVCVGIDVPARSPRPPSRLPAVIQQYLLRENLQFSEDQPGLLRVVIC
ncbi:CTC-interacting domain 7 [Wolffia australiana]